MGLIWPLRAPQTQLLCPGSLGKGSEVGVRKIRQEQQKTRGSVGAEAACSLSAAVVGPSGAQDPHRRLYGCSLPPPHFRLQEASLCSSVPLLSCPHTHTSGAAQAMRGALWECRKEPAPEEDAWREAFALGEVPQSGTSACAHPQGLSAGNPGEKEPSLSSPSWFGWSWGLRSLSFRLQRPTLCSLILLTCFIEHLLCTQHIPF